MLREEGAYGGLRGSGARSGSDLGLICRWGGFVTYPHIRKALQPSHFPTHRAPLTHVQRWEDERVACHCEALQSAQLC